MLINKGEVPGQMGKEACVNVFTVATQFFSKSELVPAVYCKHVLVMEFTAVPVIKGWVILTMEISSCKF